ncbi:hypothetical protein [Streptomyces sp. NPDC005407]
MPDSVAGTRFVERVAAAHPTLCKAWVEGGYHLTSSSVPPASAST